MGHVSGQGIRLPMKDFDEYDDAMDLIKQSLEELVKMGLVEVVGITPEGQWLYGATELGNELASKPGFAEAMRMLEFEQEEED
jgi:hypothetical protein